MEKELALQVLSAVLRALCCVVSVLCAALLLLPSRCPPSHAVVQEEDLEHFMTVWEHSDVELSGMPCTPCPDMALIGSIDLQDAESFVRRLGPPLR